MSPRISNGVNPLRFAVAQMNPVVGDFNGNAGKIMSWIEQAEKKQVDLIVFPEMSLCGYPVWDLANKKAFIEVGLKELKRIAQLTKNKNIAVVVGFIDAGTAEGVRRKENAQSAVHRTPYSHNAAAWIEKGEVRAVYHKQLLPTYDVFLENIFFQAGQTPQVLSWKGRKVGLTICEDIWDEKYGVKPLQALKKKKADLVINVSASPYYHSVAEAREKLLKKQVKEYRFPMLYVNQVGGQDDLLFDGNSLFCDARGRVLFRAPAFEEGLFFFDWSPNRARDSRVPGSTGVKEVYSALVMGVRDYFRKNGFKKALIGLSGGIDSALVAVIAVDALGKHAVKGVTMPGPYSSEGSWKDAEDLAKRLGMAFEVRPIREKYKEWVKISKIKEKEEPTLALENLQARLRGMELMFLSNDEGRLVLTTGNKSELAMGYCTLYGDMAGGLAVIGDVYKTEVYRLARYRNSVSEVIPESTLTKAPSAELRPDQKDQDSLPPYEILDEVLYLYIEKNLSRDEIINKLTQAGSSALRHREESAVVHGGRRGDLSCERLRRCARNDEQKDFSAIVMDAIRKVDHNEYKRRQTPPILRVTEKAWFGRRMPITNRFQG